MKKRRSITVSRVDLADFYRDLHAHPELSGHEHRTAERIAAVLVPLGYEVTTGVGGTGIVALLRNGDGPVVMLRADMDALPVEEKTGLPYASKVPGVMHACGHDMHVACLVGAAQLLIEARAEWSGTLMLVFQPAEETAQGARAMVADGLFERFGKPDIVLGQHVGPLPAGMVGYGTGPVMAGADSVQVTLHGRGGHGSRPETTVDPILMAANVVTRLQGIVAREVPPAETAVVTVGRVHAGTKDNVIPDTAELGINMRTYSKQTHDLVRAAIERIVRAEAAASGAVKDPEFDWNDSAPVLVSDPEATARTVAAFTGRFGADKVMTMPVITGSEDIGIFGEAAGVPTVFWFWGGLEFQVVMEAFQRGGMEALPSNHSSVFAPVLEPTLTTGVDALRVAALTWLGTAS
ncbi:N-acetyl-L,L-diaminopimelate deacetylase [Kibdelosporangium sp. 4NS15]|uniref:N-acetyl-L,L-diaminopimelate deacetylase n=1 Tax=Kibdelosporangium persicum TaxID=2698649 RepID=A0ABX2F9D9_9PSEU|nr:N-acetyl-L,L-diaminopimelate deacetylase [Kibdelosporangium persicum]